jgi:squalene-hopene/tetraprenyl-beta-curcumene cyclase
VSWLETVQNVDGGWGEDLRSYSDREWVGRGHSTASQTAWALLALLSAGEQDSPAVERGVRWLTDTQLDDGSWDEPYFTGTGFPRDFSINYHLYRMVFPLTALGRYVRREPFGTVGHPSAVTTAISTPAGGSAGSAMGTGATATAVGGAAGAVTGKGA